MSVYSLSFARECGCRRDAKSQNEKEIYFMLSNNKFLGKYWYGRHPWIRLAMDYERMVKKGINFILCLGTAYDVSSMESGVVAASGRAAGSKIYIRRCHWLEPHLCTYQSEKMAETYM